MRCASLQARGAIPTEWRIAEDVVLCPSCQHDNPEGARFCNACGAKLESTCPGCGHVNPPGSRYCNEGGTPLSAGSKPLVSSSKYQVSRSHPPSSYTPPHLAERIR